MEPKPILDDEENEPELIPYADQIKCTCCCGRKWTQKFYILLLFTLTNAFLFADQNLLAPNLTTIAEEFNFTDDERDTYLGGYISLGFFAVGGVVAMAAGLLADMFNRKYVFALFVTLGELSCMATYWVPTGTKADFWAGLWVTRSVTGVAIGAALPIQFSIMGDLFSDGTRGRAVAFFSIANGVGAGVGQYMANIMAPDWRTPFLIVSLPTFLILAIYMATTIDPPRGAAEDVLKNDENVDTVKLAQPTSLAHTLDKEKLRQMLSRVSALLIILQGLPGSLPWGIVQVFLNDFLKEEKDFSNTDAANTFVFFGAGAAMATIFGGMIQDKLWKKSDGKYRVYLPIISATSVLFSPFLLHVILAVEPGEMSLGVYAIVLFFGGLCAGLAGPIIKGILLVITLPETRGSAFALQSLLDELGKGLGPYLVSVIIAVAPDKQTGLIIGVYGWIPTAFMQYAVSCYLEKDLATNEREMLAEYGDGSVETEDNEKKPLASSDPAAKKVDPEVAEETHSV